MRPDPHLDHLGRVSPEAEPLIELESLASTACPARKQSSEQYLPKGSDLPLDLKRIGPVTDYYPPEICGKCYSTRQEYFLQQSYTNRLWKQYPSSIAAAQRRIRYIHLITNQIQYWAETSLFRRVKEEEISTQSLYAMDLMNTFSTALNIRYPYKLFQSWDTIKCGGVLKPRVFWDYLVNLLSCGSWGRSGLRWRGVKNGVVETKRHLWVWHSPQKVWNVFELFNDFAKVKEEFAFLGISEAVDPNEEDLKKLGIININKDISHGRRLGPEVYDRALKGMREWLEKEGFAKPVWKKHTASI